MKADIDIFRAGRAMIYKVVKDVPQEKLLAIPEGFANNIAWNLGHVIMAQRGLVYGRAGMDLGINRSYIKMYAPGTSPQEWAREPNIEEIMDLLVGHADELSADFTANRFADITYDAYSTSTRFDLNSIEDAIAFTNFHDGLHLGVILSLLDNV